LIRLANNVARLAMKTEMTVITRTVNRSRCGNTKTLSYFGGRQFAMVRMPRITHCTKRLAEGQVIFS
jgi:hypothetical protein